ncbi:LysR family transcriptional regulator [Mitsuaria sp. WAJ17]|uniref:LysR family transcriptional regulator n=1 Tax=Mitsuaria sp. WAJ17 TaxID=2761452 RepID=UPI001603D5D0|nr:LysR family transcriptional regulator [Mitsuaria sp. WAJ17]MBB2487620.1 LysR family transcriptional regulator [Mitsuaria sp. WAJ17]
MDKLSGLLAFVRAAERGSFVAAGRELAVSASAVGKAVAKLEEELGVRLMHRSTRSVQLTEEGRQFHERCRRILEDLDDARAQLSQTVASPRGRLRVSAPIVGHHLLMPLLPGFLSAYPEVELDLVFTDRTVDLIEESVDVVIRSGELPDSRLVSRPLSAFRLLLCASPAYLADRPAPKTVAELQAHVAVRFRHPNTGKLLDWPLPPGSQDMNARLRTVLACNNIEALKSAALRGAGIACMPDFLVRDELADGRLQEVLAGQVCMSGRFNALWATSRQLSPKVRAFVDWLAGAL